MHHMEIHTVKDDPIFLYRMVPGICNQTWGSICASKSGISDAILKRSDQFTQRYLAGECLINLSEVFRIEELSELESFLQNLSNLQPPDLLKLFLQQ